MKDQRIVIFNVCLLAFLTLYLNWECRWILIKEVISVFIHNFNILKYLKNKNHYVRLGLMGSNTMRRREKRTWSSHSSWRFLSLGKMRRFFSISFPISSISPLKLSSYSAAIDNGQGDGG